jgi:uncharacterized protein YndB with AHSA1/START domain
MKNYIYNPLFENTGTGNVHFKVAAVINAKIETVWDNVCKADKLKQYFTSDARRDLDKGGLVLWAWGDEGALLNVLEVYNHEKIVFEWNGHKVDYKVKTQFIFEKKNSKVLLQIKEAGWEMNEDGMRSAFANCSGWSEYLSALKVYTEYNICFMKK